jgi:3-oxoacyl-[acyl-carrier-protein] synthase-3
MHSCLTRNGCAFLLLGEQWERIERSTRMARYAHIVGWGMSVPKRIMTNDDWAQLVDTSDEWIRSRTGIVERRIAGEGESTLTLAMEAARRALDVAKLSPAQLDLVIVATVTPEHIFPATACLLQDQLGAINAGAFDLSAGCSGFIYALSLAADSIRAGSYQHILIIGAETLSRIVDWSDRNTCVLFGDGAGAVVVSASEVPGGILSSVLGSDGSGGDHLMIPAGGSLLPPSHETIDKKLHYTRMNGREVFRFASRTMDRAARQACEKANVQLDDIDLLVPHQANKRIIQSAARSLKLEDDLVFSNLDRYGNTSAASIPIALCEAIEAGRVQRHDHLVLVGFGAGLTWGAIVIQWGVPLPVTPAPWWLRMFRWIYYRWARVRSWSARQRRAAEDWLPLNGRNGFHRNGASSAPPRKSAEPERGNEPQRQESQEPTAEADQRQ